MFVVEKLRIVVTGKGGPGKGPVMLRRLFEYLQFTFIKLGQILAMRHDFLPREYCMELMGLLDSAPPFKDKKAIKIIEKELGGGIDELFLAFDRKHISAASFGQVYRAVLPSGEKVAIKVLRPGIRPIVHAELAFLMFIIRVVDFSCILGTFRMAPFIADFVAYTREELDYLQEARYIRKIYYSQVKNPLEKIPMVYDRYTTGKVLTIEFLEGVWMNEILYAINADDREKLEELKGKGIDFETVAKNLMLNSLIQAFEKNYYHADPHAANICIMENNVIGYVDFGIVGRLDKRFRENTLSYLAAFFKDDIDEAYDAFLDIIHAPDNVDLKGFEKEMKELMITWLEDVRDPTASLSDRSALRRMFREGRIMRKYNLYFPEVTSRFYRLLMISDVIILQLAPKLNLLDITNKYLKKLMVKNWKEKIARQDFAEIYVEAVYTMLTMPKRINALLNGWEKMVKQSGKTIKKLKTVPSKIASFFGKLSLFSSAVLFLSHLFFKVDVSFQLLGISFSTPGTCLILLGVWVLLIWVSRYLISR
jgi:ubiquinone biosynthesis protein